MLIRSYSKDPPFGGVTDPPPGPLLSGVAEGQINLKKALYFCNENPIYIVFLYKY